MLENFIQTELNIPNHINELKTVNKIIVNLKLKLTLLVKHDNLNGKEHKILYEEIVRVLDYIGKLSMPAFGYETSLEEMYYLKYRSTPKLAKYLWVKHYAEIHSPYNKYKNRCFKLLKELDEAYQFKFNSNPPNWKI